MLLDRYDNPLSTTSPKARDLYVKAVDSILSAGPEMEEEFEAVVAEDPNFAMGYSGLARARQIKANATEARAAMAKAQSLSAGVTSQEASHLNAMELLITSRVREAYVAIREHVALYPRDAMLAQTCTSVFGLIGFSGKPGREAELLAYTTELAPHYGEDWWFLSQHAFSYCETGQVDRASEMIDRSLAIKPDNSHAAHVRSHADYEAGETEAGISYLENWLQGFDKRGIMHGHLSWHVALWALQRGEVDRMWQTIDRDVVPKGSKGLPINIITDNASILYRAELAGVDVPAERWKTISDYASAFFPDTGLGFVDVHAALAHAMAGNGEAAEKIAGDPKGPAADLVRPFAEAFGAIAKGQWAEATSHFTSAMADDARIGGSRAQRDLLEYSLLGTLLKQGRGDEAHRMLALRRPTQATTPPVLGM